MALPCALWTGRQALGGALGPAPHPAHEGRVSARVEDLVLKLAARRQVSMEPLPCRCTPPRKQYLPHSPPPHHSTNTPHTPAPALHQSLAAEQRLSERPLPPAAWQCRAAACHGGTDTATAPPDLPCALPACEPGSPRLRSTKMIETAPGINCPNHHLGARQDPRRGYARGEGLLEGWKMAC